MLKKISLLALMGIALVQVQAQTDTTKAPETAADTMQIGNIIILKNGSSTGSGRDELTINIHRRHWDYPSNVTTNWLSLDLGFNGFSDQTNYSGLTSGYGAGTNKELFDLRNGKSVNVNIWFVMQHVNLLKHVVSLQYGLGLEFNNYRYKQPVRYNPSPGATLNPPILSLDQTLGRTYKKDKLATSYATVPLMLNFSFTPYRLYPFELAGGVSVGYLYASRNKTITSDEGKKKARDDFDLRP